MPTIVVEGISFNVRADAILAVNSGDIAAIREMVRSKLYYYVTNCNTSRRRLALWSKADVLYMQQNSPAAAKVSHALVDEMLLDVTNPVGPPGDLSEGDDPDNYTFERLFADKAPTMQPGQTLYEPVNGSDVPWTPAS